LLDRESGEFVEQTGDKDGGVAVCTADSLRILVFLALWSDVNIYRNPSGIDWCVLSFLVIDAARFTCEVAVTPVM